MSIELVISGGDSFTFGAEMEFKADDILSDAQRKLNTPQVSEIDQELILNIIREDKSLNQIDRFGREPGKFRSAHEIELLPRHAKPSILGWANIMANKFNAMHINTAMSGRSNSFIVRQVTNTVHQALKHGYKPEEIFVQVMWTFTPRQEIAINVDTERQDSPWFPIDPYVCGDESKSDWFKTVPKNTENWKESRDVMHKRYLKNKSIGLVDYAKSYYLIIGDMHHIYNSLFEILSLQEMLEKKNIKYLFTYVSKHVMNGLISTEKFTDSLHHFIKFDEWYKFPGDDKYVGFDDWAKFNKYEYATSHPLEKAHEDAAELIYDHISNIRR